MNKFDKNSDSSGVDSDDLVEPFDVHAKLTQAVERIKTLLAQQPVVHSSEQGEQSPEQCASQPAEWMRLHAIDVEPSATANATSSEPIIDQSPPRKEYDFEAAARHTEAEYKRLYPKIRAKWDSFFKVPKAFKIPKAPKFEKEVKFPPPPRPKQPKPMPQRGSDDDVIEMVLQFGSGINGVPIYEPKLGSNRCRIKRPPRF